MPRLRRSLRQLAEMLENPSQALRESSYWEEPLCRRWLDHVDDRVHFDRREARALAILGVRLSLRVVRKQERRVIRHRCVLVRAYAVMASAQRANGDLRSANRYLEKAANIADGCTSGDDRAEVKIRFTMLLLYRAQDHEGSFDPAELRAALEQADLAIELSKSSLTKARALNARGVVRVRSGDPSGGAQDAKRALTLLGSMHRPFDHASATSVLIWALAHGTQAEREEAIEHLERLRKALPPRSPEMRARLFWAEALLYVPNRRRKARAKRLLDRARKTFLKLEMHAEAIAVTAELARIDPAGAVPHLCTELLSILDQHPVRRLVERLHRARLVERVDLADQLRASLQAPGLLPVPAWPRS